MPTPIEKGQTFGCWVVVRQSTPDSRGRARYLCRTSCCGREVIRLGYNLHHAPPHCVHCKGNGQAR